MWKEINNISRIWLENRSYESYGGGMQERLGEDGGDGRERDVDVDA